MRTRVTEMKLTHGNGAGIQSRFRNRGYAAINVFFVVYGMQWMSRYCFYAMYNMD